MTVMQVVQMSNWSKSVVYEEIKKGKLKATKIKMGTYTKYEISEEDCKEWMEKRENEKYFY